MANPTVIQSRDFETLVAIYSRRWGVSLVAVSPDGAIVERADTGAPAGDDTCDNWRERVVQEAWRWGDPSVFVCPHGQLQWGVPLMHNQLLVGGLVASIAEDRAFAATTAGEVVDVRAASRELRLAAERLNLTNASALATRRQIYQNEQQRAYALHSYKRRRHQSVRELYLHEEPALLAAIRSGDAEQAYAVLERIAVAVQHYAGRRLDTIKGYFMELVVTMGRAAVEAGGGDEDLFGAAYTNTTGLAKIESLGDLQVWLRCMLDIALGAVQRRRANESVSIVTRAVAYLEQHAHSDLGRDDLARVVGVSPAHLSHLIRQETGSTFTDLLNRIRIDRAADLLIGTRRSLSEIALECGFSDQSYFTKVFKRYRKRTPLRFRRDFAEA